jgi:hypothetical protein
MLVDRGESKDDVIQANQVLRGNRIPGQLGIFVVIGGDADMNNNGGLKRIYPSTGLRAASFPRGRKRYDLKTSTDRGRKLISPRHYLTNFKIFRGKKNLLNTKCVVWLTPQS